MPENESEEKSARSVWPGEGFRWIIVTLLIPFVGFVWNEVQKSEATRQAEFQVKRDELQAQIANARSESDVVMRLMPALSDPDPKSVQKAIALTILLDLAERKALSPDLVGAVKVAVEAVGDRVRAGTASDTERAALGRIASVADVPPTGSEREAVAEEQKPALTFRVNVPRVYIQIFDDADRAAATALQTWIKDDQHWLAPGIENVVATAARTGRSAPNGASTGDVRYFNDEDSAQAKEIADRLGKNGKPWTVTRSQLKAPLGQMEVWFPKRPESGKE